MWTEGFAWALLFTFTSVDTREVRKVAHYIGGSTVGVLGTMPYFFAVLVLRKATDLTCGSSH
jgi:hypothetical protein